MSYWGCCWLSLITVSLHQDCTTTVFCCCCCCLHINRSGLNHTYPVIYVVANPVRGHKEVPRSTGHIMVTTRYSDQQGSKSRQKVMRLYKRWHRPIAKRFIKLSLLHIGSSLDRLGLLSPTHDQRSQQQIGQTRSNQFSLRQSYFVDLMCLTSPAHSTNIIIELSLDFAYYGGIWQAAQTCSNDLPGVEDAGACCVAACGICGGSGCGDRAQDAGLSGSDCCVGAIRDAGVYCDDSMAAPCLIGSGKCLDKAG